VPRRSDCGFVVRLPPVAPAHRPAAEGNDRNLQISLTEFDVLHGPSILAVTFSDTPKPACRPPEKYLRIDVEGGDTMRAVVQRVSESRVTVGGETVGEIGRGLLVLLGVGEGDQESDAQYLAEKVAGLRIFEDAEGKMNLSVADVGGSVLVVSQFTLYGDCRKGRRPSFTDAAPPERADELYQVFAQRLSDLGVPTATGEFQARMAVSLVNGGPVTLLLDSRRQF